MKYKIIVVGGYGKVGGVISNVLGSKYLTKVYATGRNYLKTDWLRQRR